MYSLDRKSNHLLSILVLFLFIHFPLVSFGAKDSIGFAILGIVWFLILVRTHTVCISGNRKWYLFFVSIVAFWFILPYSHRDRGSFLYLLLLMLCLGFVLKIKTNRREVAFISNCILVVSLFFSLYVIFCTFFSDIYIRYILPNLYISDEITVGNVTEAEVIIHNLSIGYGVPIGGSTVYLYYCLVFSSSILIGRFFCPACVRKKLGMCVLLLIYIIAIFMGGRRGETAAVLITLIFVTATCLIWMKKAKRFVGLIISLGVVMLLFAGFVILYGESGFLGRYASLVNALGQLKSGNLWNLFNSISTGRGKLWQLAIQLFCETPFWGIGWKKFGQFVPSGWFSYGVVEDVHNTYLQFLCETGMIGVFLLLLPVIVIFASSIRYFRSTLKKGIPQEASVLLSLTSSFGIQLFLLLDNLIDPAFYHYQTCILYAVGIYLANYVREHASACYSTNDYGKEKGKENEEIELGQFEMEHAKR